MIRSVTLVGLGEVGLVFAESLLSTPITSLCVWDRAFSDPSSKASLNLLRLGTSSKLHVAPDAGSAALDSDLVLCAVTADEALAAAASVLGGLASDTAYVDVNSVSPGTKIDIASLVQRAGGRFIEASIMSPIHPLGCNSPILLGGLHAAEFLREGSALGFTNMQIASEELGVASATKMCRSVIVKGIEALVSESLLTARRYGVEQTVLESLNNLFPGPDWSERARYLISRTLEHGARRSAEMREVARTVEEAGQDSWMSLATVERQAWAAGFASAVESTTLEGMLDAILDQSV